jgi:hypothetical protein
MVSPEGKNPDFLKKLQLRLLLQRRDKQLYAAFDISDIQHFHR